MRIRDAITFAALLASCGPAWANRKETLSRHLWNLEDELLTLHNKERAAVGARALVWDHRLARDAADYARTLYEKHGTLIHASQEERRGKGENLWMGTVDRYSVARMFDGWAREKQFFRPGIFPDIAKGVPLNKVGHYTQIIWRDVERVGCGVYQSGEWDYLVCRYDPGGNVYGQAVP